MIRRIAAAVLIACSAFLAAIPATAQFADQATFATANGGTGTALTATIPNATSITDLKGVIIKIVPSTGNTGDTTLTVNGFGSPPHIYKPSPSGPVLLTGGELVALQPAWLMLDASGNFNLLSVTSTSFGAASITNSALSFGVPVNLQLNATVSSNNLTIAIKGNNGSDPSATNPVLIPFRDSTIANGDPNIVSLQGALSFTIASSNTMGCVSGQMCRLWIVAFNNGGTVAVGAFNALSGFNVAPINEAALQTSASGTSGGSSAQTYYASTSAVTANAIRIIGYVEIQEVTAGTWATGPTYVQLFGPGIKKPGDPVQTLSFMTTTVGSTTNASYTALSSGQTGTITPTSAANLVRVLAQGSLVVTSTGSAFLQIVRSSTVIGNPTQLSCNSTACQPIVPSMILGYDLPNATSVQTYSFQGKINAGTLQYPAASTGAILELQEIMSALPESANDNGSVERRMVG